jgi:hypothetical protein
MFLFVPILKSSRILDVRTIFDTKNYIYIETKNLLI